MFSGGIGAARDPWSGWTGREIKSEDAPSHAHFVPRSPRVYRQIQRTTLRPPPPVSVAFSCEYHPPPSTTAALYPTTRPFSRLTTPPSASDHGRQRQGRRQSRRRFREDDPRGYVSHTSHHSALRPRDRKPTLLQLAIARRMKPWPPKSLANPAPPPPPNPPRSWPTALPAAWRVAPV